MYKKILFTVLCLNLACNSVSKKATPDSLTSAKEYQIRPFKEVKLSNGLQVLLMPDSSLPYFSLALMIKAGADYPVTTPGLPSLVATLLEKGTITRSATDIADSFGQIGSDFDVDVDNDYTWFMASSLTMDQDQLLKDFSEVILQPQFSDAEIERRREQVLSSLTRYVDNPNAITDLIFKRHLYQEHPYAYSNLGTKDVIKNIKRKDIQNYYNHYYRPNNAYLSVVGQYDEKELLKKLETYFKPWQPQKLDSVKLVDVSKSQGVDLLLINRSDLTQSQIRIGSVSIQRSSPDFLRARMLATILGDGFMSSRLMSEVRVKRGLTYGISSYFSPEKDYGPFVISTFSRNEKVGETIQVTLQVLKEFVEKGVTEQEVEEAKATLKGNFPRQLETAEAVARSLLTLKFHGISYDYLTNYLTTIDNMTVAELNESAGRLINPNNLKILVYAPENAVKPQVVNFGKYTAKKANDFL